MDTNPLVSVIVRTKDRPDFLRRALISIAAQTYRPIEVVVVNDGGRELDIQGLREVLGGIFLNYIRLDENRGRAHAGNLGIGNAKGQYIGFLDDDDEWHPGHLQALAPVLAAGEAKVAYTDTEMVNQEYDEAGGRFIDRDRTVFCSDFSYPDLLIGNYIPFISVLFDREVLREAGGIDEGFELYEDWDLLIRAGERHPFRHVGIVTARYNQWNPESQINRSDSDRMREAELRIVSKHWDKIRPVHVLDLRHGKELAKSALSRADGRIADIESALREKDLRISQLDAILAEKEARLRCTAEEMERMRHTLGWQMIEGLRRMREHALPQGTGRRRAFDRIVGALKWGRAAETVSAGPAAVQAGGRPGPSVLFVISPWAGFTNRYRVYNIKEYLDIAGMEHEIIDIRDLHAEHPWALNFDIVVIHRIPMNDLLRDFISECRDRSIPVVFDLDDYIFEPSLADRIEEVNRLDEAHRNEWMGHIKGCREAILAADYFTGITEFIADRVRELGRPAFVIRNGLNRTQIRESERALREVQRDPRRVKIGYFSGSSTHQRDFATALPALSWLLGEYPNLSLCIGGHISPDRTLLAEFPGQVEVLPYVDWKELPFNIARTDINIVPLEPGNPFCEAKSELKYFEAALLRIPTVASPTDAYRWAIRHGENGLLAAGDSQWYTCLKSLIDSPELRERIGGKAFEMVIATYTPEAQAKKVRELYGEIWRDYKEKKACAVQPGRS